MQKMQVVKIYNTVRGKFISIIPSDPQWTHMYFPFITQSDLPCKRRRHLFRAESSWVIHKPIMVFSCKTSSLHAYSIYKVCLKHMYPSMYIILHQYKVSTYTIACNLTCSSFNTYVKYIYFPYILFSINIYKHIYIILHYLCVQGSTSDSYTYEVCPTYCSTP